MENIEKESSGRTVLGSAGTKFLNTSRRPSRALACIHRMHTQLSPTLRSTKKGVTSSAEHAQQLESERNKPDIIKCDDP